MSNRLRRRGPVERPTRAAVALPGPARRPDEPVVIGRTTSSVPGRACGERNASWPAVTFAGTFEIGTSASGLAVEHGVIALPDGTPAATSFYNCLTATD